MPNKTISTVNALPYTCMNRSAVTNPTVGEVTPVDSLALWLLFCVLWLLFSSSADAENRNTCQVQKSKQTSLFYISLLKMKVNKAELYVPTPKNFGPRIFSV